MEFQKSTCDDKSELSDVKPIEHSTPIKSESENLEISEYFTALKEPEDKQLSAKYFENVAGDMSNSHQSKTFDLETDKSSESGTFGNDLKSCDVNSKEQSPKIKDLAFANDDWAMEMSDTLDFPDTLPLQQSEKGMVTSKQDDQEQGSSITDQCSTDIALMEVGEEMVGSLQSGSSVIIQQDNRSLATGNTAIAKTDKVEISLASANLPENTKDIQNILFSLIGSLDEKPSGDVIAEMAKCDIRFPPTNPSRNVIPEMAKHIKLSPKTSSRDAIVEMESHNCETSPAESFGDVIEKMAKRENNSSPKRPSEDIAKDTSNLSSDFDGDSQSSTCGEDSETWTSSETENMNCADDGQFSSKSSRDVLVETLKHAEVTEQTGSGFSAEFERLQNIEKPNWPDKDSGQDLAEMKGVKRKRSSSRLVTRENIEAESHTGCQASDASASGLTHPSQNSKSTTRLGPLVLNRPRRKR